MISKVRDKEYDNITGLNQLQYAVWNNRLDEVKYLIESGHIQNINYPVQNNTMTALDISINEGYREISNYLVTNNARRFHELTPEKIKEMSDNIDKYNRENDYLDENYVRKGEELDMKEKEKEDAEEEIEEQLDFYNSALEDNVDSSYLDFLVKIRKIIKKSGQKKKNIAISLNMDYQRFSHIITGNRPMTGKEMIKLAIYFGVNLFD